MIAIFICGLFMGIVWLIVSLILMIPKIVNPFYNKA